ncbi:uncharacterized protein BP01DRAFT_49872 [Aspergillus saccharolyticus JOP 1030-1]|uniref:Uncharacterized protein n=1 Tax=Aspergillus saccharolyticus JOP 1030-1 TaxID=1450539 RepID=A0A318ZZ40_9EURO|nr:hypothetical protein BP01DRAFT_49872 [Aspergillus saccharolyticus JOP 1030-1]PYH45358.1 hypothetical protein BP01DRAFT_49872 [Aspergillus saccharolyticus JOP 1030-1]
MSKFNRRLRLQGALYTLDYQVEHKMPFIATQQLAMNNNPVRLKIAHMYKTRPRDTLWYSMSHRLLLSRKSVVRTWALGRSRVAFRKALEERGYDRDGRAIPSVPRAKEEEKRLTSLRGTADFTVREEVIKAKFSDIEKDMRHIVDRMIKTSLAAPVADKDKVSPVQQRVLYTKPRKAA